MSAATPSPVAGPMRAFGVWRPAREGVPAGVVPSSIRATAEGAAYAFAESYGSTWKNLARPTPRGMGARVVEVTITVGAEVAPFAPAPAEGPVPDPVEG